MAEKNENKKDVKKTVRYVGTSDVRSISAGEWSQVGVEGQSDVVWDKSNDHTVNASDLNAAALEVLGKNSDFKLSE